MKNPYRRTWAAVDLDALSRNMRAMRERLPEQVRMAGVVKADGYGHGAAPVAREISPFVDLYCVASAEEALNLKLHGATKPVLVLSPVPGEDYDALVREGIRATVFTEEEAAAVSRAAVRAGGEANVHLAVDTGMNRIGMQPTEEGAATAERIAAMPGIRIEGIFTHLYRADEADLSVSREQVRRFRTSLSLLAARGIRPALRHVANSAGIMELIGAEFDMVRAGITMYGVYPSGEVRRETLPLCPVLSWKSCVTYVKWIEEGAEVSYGGTFRAPEAVRVATVAVGYGDGYPRMLSGSGEILIAGKRAKILGRICMDQLMADVSDIPEAAAGSEVTLLGRDGTEEISVEELSVRSGRFPYEFLCDIGRRVPRIYLRNGELVGVKDWFHDRYDDFGEAKERSL